MKETLNLLPLRERARAARGPLFYAVMVAGLYLLAISGISFYNLWEARRLQSGTKRLESLRQELLGRISAAVPAALPPTAEKEIADAVMQTPPWRLILGELSVIVPEKVWLSLIDVKKTDGAYYMTIKGFSKTQVDAARLVSSLEGSPYFSNLQIVFSQKGEKDAVFEFKVRLKWT